MKINITRLSLAAAVATTIITSIKPISYRILPLFDYFVPVRPPREYAQIPEYSFKFSFTRILIIFIVTFIIIWILATLFNTAAKKNREL